MQPEMICYNITEAFPGKPRRNTLHIRFKGMRAGGKSIGKTRNT